MAQGAGAWTGTTGPSIRQRHDIDIAVVHLPHIANFTDFDPLDVEPTVGLKYLGLKDEIGHPDAVILPGSKTTIEDLIALEKSGMAKKLKNYAQAGGIILGICGGFQILGRRVSDPEAIESDKKECLGLNLLPI